jgi:CheY-like chemotaxis protein
VRDSGIGIAPEMLGRVFEPFVQAEQSLARTQGGLGIGLSMVRSLVALHGGTVEVHSAGPGQGSEFVVRLSLAVSSEAEPRRVLEPETLEAPRAPGRRVLVVDDNEDAALSLAELLGLWGHEARTALDGPAALEIAQVWHPEIVLLDIGLPGMDGYEVAGRLRHQPACAGALIVALTGYGGEDDRRRALESGFDSHLTKPASVERLQVLLHQAHAASGFRPHLCVHCPARH